MVPRRWADGAHGELGRNPQLHVIHPLPQIWPMQSIGTRGVRKQPRSLAYSGRKMHACHVKLLPSLNRIPRISLL